MSATIRISEQALRAQGVRITDYVRSVIEWGHEPGTLSGAALRGSAKIWGGKYQRTRARVANAVQQITASQGTPVTEGYWLNGNRRHVRVWITTDGAPIRLSLTKENKA